MKRAMYLGRNASSQLVFRTIERENGNEFTLSPLYAEALYPNGFTYDRVEASEDHSISPSRFPNVRRSRPEPGPDAGKPGDIFEPLANTNGYSREIGSLRKMEIEPSPEGEACKLMVYVNPGDELRGRRAYIIDPHSARRTSNVDLLAERIKVARSTPEPVLIVDMNSPNHDPLIIMPRDVDIPSIVTSLKELCKTSGKPIDVAILPVVDQAILNDQVADELKEEGLIGLEDGRFLMMEDFTPSKFNSRSLKQWAVEAAASGKILSKADFELEMCMLPKNDPFSQTMGRSHRPGSPKPEVVVFTLDDVASIDQSLKLEAKALVSGNFNANSSVDPFSGPEAPKYDDSPSI